MEKNRVRWGVLGCSGIGKNRTIPAMLSTSNAELYAIAGRNEEKLKAYAEPFAPKKLYTDYQALLNDENVDAVYVPLPNGLHMEWVIKAAKAGKYILCEKPLAMNEEQVKKMFVAVKANHVLLEEAYAYRHAQLAQRVSLSIAARSVGSAIRRGRRDFERFFLRSAGPQCGAGNIQCRKGCREKSQRIHGSRVCGRQYPGAGLCAGYDRNRDRCGEH